MLLFYLFIYFVTYLRTNSKTFAETEAPCFNSSSCFIHFRLHRNAQRSHVHRKAPPPHGKNFSLSSFPPIRFSSISPFFPSLSFANDEFRRKESSSLQFGNDDGGPAASTSFSRQCYSVVLEFAHAGLYLMFLSVLRFSLSLTLSLSLSLSPASYR